MKGKNTIHKEDKPMKKLVSVLSAAAVAVSMFTPAAFAESADSEMKNVLVSVKERVKFRRNIRNFQVRPVRDTV